MTEITPKKASTRLTTAEFIERAAPAHQQKYDYSKAVYTNWTGKLIIICPRHGEFVQRADRHMYGNGCPSCYAPKIPTLPDLISKAIIVHGDKYDYSKADYTGATTKTEFVCRIHGVFKQFWSQHLAGQGCNKCGRLRMAQKLSHSFDSFLLKARAKYGDKYDYVEIAPVVSKKSKIQIICRKHGPFTKSIAEFLRGRDCSKCAAELSQQQLIEEATAKYGDRYEFKIIDGKSVIFCKRHGRLRYSIGELLKQKGCGRCSREVVRTIKSAPTKDPQQLIATLQAIHNYRYQYILTNYPTAHEKINIICQKHGIFEQRLSKHKQGRGCMHCAYINMGDLTRKPQDQYLAEVRAIHGDRYSYESTQYVSNSKHITVTCKDHGPFQIMPGMHLRYESGCPKCTALVSKPHRELADFIGSIYGGPIELNDRQAIKPYEIDIWLPELRFGIECHGDYWHSYNREETPDERNRHKYKADLAQAQQISLFQFFEHELLTKPAVVRSMIGHKLGLSTKIHARRCELRTVPTSEYTNFMAANHLYEPKAATYKLGLYHQGELVYCVSFSSHKLGFEIIRLATKCGYAVVGGASRVISYFREINPKIPIFTYADRRISAGAVYSNVGFKSIGTTKPGYRYISTSGRSFSRLKFQKHKLKELLNDYDPTKTEAANMFANGYRRCWDAGHTKLIVGSEIME